MPHTPVLYRFRPSCVSILWSTVSNHPVRYGFRQSCTIQFPSLLYSTVRVNHVHTVVQYSFHHSCTSIACGTIPIYPVHYNSRRSYRNSCSTHLFPGPLPPSNVTISVQPEETSIAIIISPPSHSEYDGFNITWTDTDTGTTQWSVHASWQMDIAINVTGLEPGRLYALSVRTLRGDASSHEAWLYPDGHFITSK